MTNIYNMENGAKGRTYRQRQREAEERTPWTVGDVITTILGTVFVIATMYALIWLNHITL